MKTIAIIQARMESSRLPGKVLKIIAGQPMLLRIVAKARKSKCLDEVIVATSLNTADDVIEKFCIKEKIPCFRGSIDNVLERYYQCAKQYQGEIIIRLTADNVFVDTNIIDEAIEYFQSNGQIDYLYYKEGLPLGVAVEVFTMKALEKTYKETKLPECCEHVTLYMYRNPEKFKCIRCSNQEDYSAYRLTMDTPQDYQLITALYNRLSVNGEEISYEDVIKELQQNEQLREINRSVEQKVPEYKIKE